MNEYKNKKKIMEQQNKYQKNLKNMIDYKHLEKRSLWEFSKNCDIDPTKLLIWLIVQDVDYILKYSIKVHSSIRYQNG